MASLRSSTLGLFICSSMLLLASQLASANSETLKTDEPSIKSLERFDVPRDAISRRVTRFANWLDGFFGENRIFQESQDSYLKLNLINTIEEDRSHRYDARLKGKLTLPNTKKRLKLLLESEPEQGADVTTYDTALEALESQQQSVGLRYIPVESEVWRVNTDVGARFRSSNLDTFVRLRMRRLFPFDPWLIRLSESLYWYDSIGPGSTSRLDLERILDDDYLFRASSIATWLDENRYFDLSQEFSLFHNFDSRRAIAYQAAVNGRSEPDTHVTSYVLSLRLRQQIHRDWLFFEINPAITYPEENDFNAVKSISFKLEIIFGGN